MPTIEFAFPADRYHATTWGSHVNEAQIEWPPSPWRLLRTLLSVGYTRFHWDRPPEVAFRLVRRLSSVLPAYRLPIGTEAHSRHYMPTIEGSKEKPTKVIDAFLRFAESESMLVRYDVDLPDDEAALLADLVGSVTYLGRAESWADARLVTPEPPIDSTWVTPHQDDMPASVDTMPITLIAPAPFDRYDQWREAELPKRLADEAAQRGKKLTAAQRKKIEAAYPSDLLACLQWDTADIKQHRWSQPPGSRMVIYQRPSATAIPRHVQPLRYESAPVDSALIRLAIDRRRATRLPSMTRCLPQAEAVHQTLVATLNREGRSSPAITGRTETGGLLRTNHGHAHYIPLDLDADGCIDHLLIHAPMQLDDAAQQAIRKLRRTWAKGIPSILLRWVGFSSLDELREQLKARGGQTPAVLDESAELQSLTPYVSPRWVNYRKRGYTIEDDIRKEFKLRDLPEPKEVKVWNSDFGEGRQLLADRRILSFKRCRQPNKPQPKENTAYGMTLVFDSPIRCPIAIGYASHFGLGLFGAACERAMPSIDESTTRAAIEQT